MKHLGAVTSEPLTSVEMFERWLMSVSTGPSRMDGRDLNCLMNSSWANWWPYSPRDFGAHYPAIHEYKVTPKTITIIHTRRLH